MSSQPLTDRPQLSHPTDHSPRAVIGFLAAAALLGLLADVGLRFGEQSDFLFVVATPWVVLAFGAGRAGGLRWSAPAGAAAVLTGIAAYYLWLWTGQGVSLSVLTGNDYKAMTWVIVGAGVGAVAGSVGGLSRLPHGLARSAAWSGVAAVPCVDAIIQLAYVQSAAPAVVAVLGATALAVLVWGWRSGSRLGLLLLGLPVATLVLWQLELVVLQHVFGRLTWI